MALYEIKSRINGKILFSHKCGKCSEAVEAAVRARVSLAGADLAGADLAGADLAGANLARANLWRADLAEANLAGANLTGANLAGAKINWKSHHLLSEILWRAAQGSTAREQLAAWIGRKTEWCWNKWLAVEHPERQWAMAELSRWVSKNKDGRGMAAGFLR